MSSWVDMSRVCGPGDIYHLGKHTVLWIIGKLNDKSKQCHNHPDTRRKSKNDRYKRMQDKQTNARETYEPGHEKMCLMSYANNKGVDQPAHPRSLISAFIVRCLDSVMSLVSVTKISSLMLASVAEQASLSLTWSETPEDTFSHNEAHIDQLSSPSEVITILNRLILLVLLCRGSSSQSFI